ncbi:MAG: hypothetical protein IJF73_06700 [Clostridia bacterium]|nr:hypothetical protein [Clostridia bacterium]
MKRWVYSIAISMILACVGVIATYSILGEPENGTTYLRAGTLEIDLFRTELAGCILGQDGAPRSISSSEEVDLGKRNAAPLFGEGEAAMLVPGSYLDATLELRNRGNVAAVYRVELKMTAELTPLAEQLTVSLRSHDGTVVRLPVCELSDGEVLLEGYLAANEKSESFGIRLELPDRSDNNAAMGSSTGIEFIVTATQATVGE